MSVGTDCTGLAIVNFLLLSSSPRDFICVAMFLESSGRMAGYGQGWLAFGMIGNGYERRHFGHVYHDV